MGQMGIRQSLEWLENSPWIGAQDRHDLRVDDWASHEETSACPCQPAMERIGCCPECGAALDEDDVLALAEERFVACRVCGQECSWTEPERPPSASDAPAT
jgi:hypothetical protein